MSSCSRVNKPIRKQSYQNKNKGYYEGNTQGKKHCIE